MLASEIGSDLESEIDTLLEFFLAFGLDLSLTDPD